MYISTLWRKVAGDLKYNKPHFFLVVLSIVLGITAVGAVSGSQAVLARELTESFLAVQPASATIYVTELDRNFVKAIQTMPEVLVAEGRRSARVRFKNGDGKWQDLILFAVPDFNHIQIDQLQLEAGTWPLGRQQIVIERDALPLVAETIGDTVLVKTLPGKEHALTLTGVTHDVTLFPASLAGVAYGYVTFDTLEKLGLPTSFNQIRIVVAKNETDREYVRQVVKQIQEKLEKDNRNVFSTYIPPKLGVHPTDDIIQSIVLLLGVLAVLTLLLASFLIINMISFILTRQLRHIGIMKSVGAKASHIMRMYVTLVLILGIAGAIFGIPLGQVGTHLVVSYIARLLNADVARYTPPVYLFILQLGIGLIIPVTAALPPILIGSRITIKAAMDNTQGETKETKQGTRVSKVTRHFWRLFSRPVALSLHNTFRQRTRLILALIPLTLGSTIFVSVYSVRASTIHTMSRALDYWQYDISVSLQDTYRLQEIEEKVGGMPGILKFEGWLEQSARLVRADGTVGTRVSMIALSPDSQFLRPTLVSGRWLMSSDTDAVVINTNLLQSEPDISIGDTIHLQVGERDISLQVVGVVTGQLQDVTVYANDTYLAHKLGKFARANQLQIVTNQIDTESQQQLAAQLEEVLQANGLQVNDVQTITQLRQTLSNQFNIVITFLLIMSMMLTAVGALGLSSVMSINVLGRTREIGVMRAIGASDRIVMQIVIVEGVFMGVISWVFGSVLALPLSQVLSRYIGLTLVKTPLVYTFPMSGVTLWLFLSIGIAIIASLVPARNAARISIREAITYE